VVARSWPAWVLVEAIVAGVELDKPAGLVQTPEPMSEIERHAVPGTAYADRGDVAAKVAPTPVSPLSQALEVLDGRVARLGAVVDDLEAKLDPVSFRGGRLDDPASPADGTGVPVVDAIAALTTLLDEHTDRIAGMIQNTAI
jgi:hypothetical protein